MILRSYVSSGVVGEKGLKCGERADRVDHQATVIVWAVKSRSSPAVKATVEARVPLNKWLPAVSASHAETCVTDSVVDTEVHDTVAVSEATPLTAASYVASLRVVSTAALAVPVSPGAPRWSFSQTFVIADGAPFPPR
jgi:hypothetical protein